MTHIVAIFAVLGRTDGDPGIQRIVLLRNAWWVMQNTLTRPTYPKSR
jgi:hypothetical protein